MGEYCRKCPMTHDQAQTALRNLYYRNNKKKRGRRKDECRPGEMHTYYCGTCKAWHVGHWRPREVAGGRFLPDEEQHNGPDSMYVVNFGNDTYYCANHQCGVLFEDADLFTYKQANEVSNSLQAALPGLPSFIEPAENGQILCDE